MPLEGCSERSKHPTTRNRFFVPNARRNGRRSRQLDQLRRGHGDSRRNCLHPIARGLSLAAFRSQYRAYDTPSRSGVRSVPPFPRFPRSPPLAPPVVARLCSSASQLLWRSVTFSRLFVAGYGSSLPGIGGEAAPDARSPGSLNTESLRTCQGLRPRRGPDCLPPTPSPACAIGRRRRPSFDGLWRRMRPVSPSESRPFPHPNPLP